MKNRQVSFSKSIKILITFICLFFLYSLNLSAQNLVLNGSFEEYNKRPESAQYSYYNRKLHYSKGWDACCTNKNDSCGSTDYYYYPNYYESKNWKLPKRPYDGNFFIGLCTYDSLQKSIFNPGPLYREYATGILAPLEIGRKYKLSLAHTDGQFFGEEKPLAHNGFGILLSTYNLVQKSDYSQLKIKPQFRTPYLLSDSIWKVMEFEFVADSVYTNITLGNFWQGSEMEIEIYKGIGLTYLFIDDIKLERIIDTPKIPEPITLCKPDSIFIENKEKKEVEWWINGQYFGWAIGLQHYYRKATNQVIVKYYNDYDTTYVFIKSKPEVKLKQEGFLCSWSDNKGFASFSSVDSLSSYHWQLLNEKVFEPKLKLINPGLVLLVFTSPKKCEWQQELETKDTCPAIHTCFFPNAFSPNNDGLNDTYKIECENVMDFEIRIFNRWGEQIFYSKNPLEAWDGTYKDARCQIGIYMTSIKATYPSEEGFYKTETRSILLNLIR